MRHQENLNELRRLLAEFVTNIRGAQSMQLYDLAHISEQLFLGLFREVFQLQALRSLNAEKKNFPGIDLADDIARVAIQITATGSLDKVKQTLELFLKHELNKKYDRLIVYVLADRQSTYSQSSLDVIQKDRYSFVADRDVLDYQGFLSRATECDPPALSRALELFRTFNRGGVPRGVSDEDFDPPKGSETLYLNLLEIYLPTVLYVADLVPGAQSGSKHGGRKAARKFAESLSTKLPSAFETHSKQLVSFVPLDSTPHPFEKIIDAGTVTTLAPREFYGIDENYEHVFKSLLRLTLQQKLYGQRVRWMQEDQLFVFLPLFEGDLTREQAWKGEKDATRTVFERKLNKNDGSKDLVLKHLAFGVDFHRFEESWYLAITPDWYFSYGQDYRRSAFADQQLGWLKRHEGNGQVMTHFRFLVAWLSALDNEDLFKAPELTPSVSFGEIVMAQGTRTLNDDLWRPAKDAAPEETDVVLTARLFK